MQDTSAQLTSHIEEILNWLRERTNKTPHSRRTLYDHLVGTYNMLKEEGADQDLCLAGLFHSIYGTSIFKVETTNERTEVQKLIGQRAEHLAWLFCQLDRPACWGIWQASLFNSVINEGVHHLPAKCGDGGILHISTEDMMLLSQLEDANLREQQIDHIPPKTTTPMLDPNHG